MIVLMLIAVAFAASFFFAGTETAFTTLNRLRIRTWSEGQGSRARAARSVQEFTAEPDRFLTTTLVGNNIAIVAVTALVGFLLERKLAGGEFEALIDLVGVLLVTPALLVFAEIIPKSLARRYPNRTALIAIKPLRALHWVLRPVAWILGAIVARLQSAFRLPAGAGRFALRREDVLDLLRGTDDGEAPDEEDKIISGILDFGSTTVREALTPRTRLVCLDVDAGEEEVLEVISSGRFSRLPVFKEDLDHIVGTVHARDLLLASRSGPIRLESHLRKVHFVPEQKKADELLEELKARKEHLAVVLDEHGGTEGIVTLEDLLELLVGDIRDEHDAPDEVLRPIDERAWTAKGYIELDDLEERIGLELPEGLYETLGGYVIDTLGRIPRKGEVVLAPGARITVLKASDRAVELLRLDLLD